MNDIDVEKEIVAKNLTHPRVTLDGVYDKIDDVEICKFISKSGQVLRWAIITMKNGFAVTGDPSCSVSSENDNQELGEKIAIENARNSIWALEGYALKEQLYKDTYSQK